MIKTFLETFGHCRSAGCRAIAWTPGIRPDRRDWTGFTETVLDHVRKHRHTVVIRPIARTVTFDGQPGLIESPTGEDYLM